VAVEMNGDVENKRRRKVPKLYHQVVWLKYKKGYKNLTN